MRALWLSILLAGTVAGQWRQFGDEMLAAHNAVRNRTGTAPLIWSDRLAEHSRDWAGTLLAKGQFAHRPNGKYGENLFEIGGVNATPAEVVSEWASEAVNYDYASIRRSSGAAPAKSDAE
jgi:uncharacterized protein YkwD